MTSSLTSALIVGGGPVGLTMSLLLAKHGVKSVVLERGRALTEHPQAHFINTRTMEILRECGRGIVDDIEAASPPLDHWRRFVYTCKMGGEELGVVDHFGPDLQAKLQYLASLSTSRVVHLAQHKLVPILARHCQLQGIPILFDHSAVKVEATSTPAAPPSVQVRLPDGSLQNMGGDFIIACDGASSVVREQLGVTLHGKSSMQHLINIHFKSRSLGRQLLSKHPAMLYFCFNVNVIAVVVAHDLSTGEFVAQVPYFPPQQCLDQFTPEVCHNLVTSIVEGAIPDLQIQSVRSWKMSSLVASTFSSRGVFLVGDSAHQFPPAGGFGMNSGIQDAHNLAWKIASVKKGYAATKILDSYTHERRSAAVENASLSERNFDATLEAPRSLGLYPWAAEAVSKLVNTPPVSLLPLSLQRQILDNTLSAGRAQLHIFDSNLNPLGRYRREALQRKLREGKSLSLLFEGQDLGMVYQGKGAAVVPLTEEEGRVVRGRSPYKYHPHLLPGARFPHLLLSRCDNGSGSSNISSAVVDADDGVCSSLDLISSNQTQFTLFCPSPLAAVWRGRVGDMEGRRQEWRDLVRVVSVAAEDSGGSGTEGGSEGGTGEGRSGAGPRPVDNHSSWRVTNKAGSKGDRDKMEAQASSVASALLTKVVLVRPDGHIVWTVPADGEGEGEGEGEREREGDSGTALEGVLEKVLLVLDERPIKWAQSSLS